MPLRSLHLTSISPGDSKPLSSCFFFITSKSCCGSFSASLTRRFCKAACIVEQPWQQNQSPFGSSCHWIQIYHKHVQWSRRSIQTNVSTNEDMTALSIPSNMTFYDPSSSQHGIPFHTGEERQKGRGRGRRRTSS